MWNISKALRTKKSPIPAIHSRNGLVYTTQEKAEAIANEFELQCSPNYEHADLEFIERIHRQVRQRINQPLPNQTEFVTAEEVRAITSKTKIKKAPGPDGIPGLAITNLPGKAIVALTNIINAILRLRHFPSNWKKAQVIVIPKPQICSQLQTHQSARHIIQSLRIAHPQ